ncbi:hypothetical protein ACFL47_02660 [Candidatus Latescibacterota bacterium]
MNVRRPTHIYLVFSQILEIFSIGFQRLRLLDDNVVKCLQSIVRAVDSVLLPLLAQKHLPVFNFRLKFGYSDREFIALAIQGFGIAFGPRRISLKVNREFLGLPDIGLQSLDLYLRWDGVVDSLLRHFPSAFDVGLGTIPTHNHKPEDSNDDDDY